MTKMITPTRRIKYANAEIQVFFANRGEGLPKHDHTYPHMTMCLNGSIEVRTEGWVKVLDVMSQPLNLVPNEWHEIEALESGTVFQNIFDERQI